MKSLLFPLIATIALPNSVNANIQIKDRLDTPHINFISQRAIANVDLEFDEPSGLVFDVDKKSLWTVSDDTSKLFNLDLKGDINRKKTINSPLDESEGITLNKKRNLLVAVIESQYPKVVTVELDSGKHKNYLLSEMKNFSLIKKFFKLQTLNKSHGLEAITFLPEEETYIVAKQDFPAMLIKINGELNKILSFRKIEKFSNYENQLNSFDISGLDYDVLNKKIWILSGLNREIYIYDWDSNTIINQYKIPYMNWAGGIAVNYDDNKFHIVTDVDNEEPMLFVHSYNPELIYQNK